MSSDMSFEIKYHEHDTGNNAKININAQKKIFKLFNEHLKMYV